MNLFKRLTALFLAVVLTCGLLPVGTLAAEQETVTFQTTHINPDYADVITEADLRPAAVPGRQTYAAANFVKNLEEAGSVLADQMEVREETATVYVWDSEYTQESFNALASNVLNAAFVHTGVPTEGDYIRWHYAGCKIGGSAKSADGGYNITLTYTFTYHASAEQEAAVDAAVEKLLSDLNLNGKTDYEKVKAVYDYMCANIRYDHSTSDSTLKHSAYAALINKTAVCQGYASLLYRLMLELGIDCRFISGIGNGGGHGWNIIELENLYYNADATWDEGQTNYRYFLKCQDNFDDHTRDEEYTTSAFNSTYPMSTTDYDPAAHTHSYTAVVTKPTCTEDGFTTYTCSCGDSYTDDEVAKLGHTEVTDAAVDATCTSTGLTEGSHCSVCNVTLTAQTEIPMTDHTWDEGTVTRQPTEEQTGIRTFHCENCDATRTEDIPVLEHQHSYTSVVTDPTCTEDGFTTYTCKCGDSYVDNYVDATGHSYGDWYQTKAPTEAEAGEERRDCENCDVYETRVVAKLEPSNPSGSCGDNLTWVFDEETGTLTISGNGEMYDYSLEAEGNPSPWLNLDISQVIISEGITSLGTYSFYLCEMEEIFLPNSLIRIGDFAFYGSANLFSVSIPANVSNIGVGAFIDCPSIGGFWVELDNQHFSTDGYGVLFDKEKTTLIQAPARLTNAYPIPDSVRYIGNHAFGGCTHITDIYIPDTVESIGESAFYSCTMLTELTLPPKLTKLSTLLFSLCENLNRVDIPDGITEFETGVFHACESLQEIIIPKTVTRLGERVFGHCSNLSRIVFTGNAPTFTEETYSPMRIMGTFSNVVTTAYYPNTNPTWTTDVMQDYGGDITWVAYSNEPATSGTCGDNLTWNFNETSGQLTVSGSGAMYGADQLGWTAFAGDIRSVEIGSGASSIGAYAFADCINLADIEMPDTVMSIAYNAFENCSSLQTVDIPNNIMEISYGSFMDCTSLAAVELPQSVMEISYRAFDNCTSLNEVEFPTGLTAIRSEAFRDCTGLDQIRFTGNAPAIQDNAFYNVTSDAYYPGANTTWTEDVRQNYGGTLTWIAEGSTVEPENSCGENVTWSFEESSGTLTISGTESMARSNGNSIMDDYARPEDAPWYSIQDQIITVVIEATVDSVGRNAFAGCSNLTTVIIEEGVSEIDSTAFSDCDSLENCYFEGTEEQWEDLDVNVGEATVHTESAEPESHTETKTTIPPTCTEQGYDLYTCSCGTTRKDNFTAPTDHTWDEGTVTREPSPEAPGIKTYTCTVCKETKTQEIPYVEQEESPVRRIFGQDRIETALAVAGELKNVLGVEKFDSIILAAGGSGQDQTKFADALSGSYLASTKKAPILLYTKGDLSPKNLAFIEENLSATGTIYLLGGNVSIPAEVEAALKAAGYSTKRLGGDTRYHTNLIILDEAGIDSADEILIAGGQAFADSLSASATGLPIMLVNGKNGNSKLNADQVAFLQGLKGKKVTILGGTAAISAELEAAIEEAFGSNVDRVFGDTREHTSAMIAEKYFADADTALIAYSKMYPDGLAGGVLANALHAPLLLTKANSESIANAYIEEYGIASGYVLGGTAVITDETARLVFGLDSNVIIGTK